MNSLSTAEDGQPTDVTTAFISVLNCSRDEATFFLESTLWNLEAAVHLFLDNNYHNNNGKKSRGFNPAGSFPSLSSSIPLNSSSSSSASSSAAWAEQHRPVYIKREICIEGLDPDWSAWVSEFNGQIYFIHNPSGHRQNEVPPGFSDSQDPCQSGLAAAAPVWATATAVTSADIWPEDSSSNSHSNFKATGSDSGSKLSDESNCHNNNNHNHHYNHFPTMNQNNNQHYNSRSSSNDDVWDHNNINNNDTSSTSNSRRNSFNNEDHISSHQNGNISSSYDREHDNNNKYYFNNSNLNSSSTEAISSFDANDYATNLHTGVGVGVGLVTREEAVQMLEKPTDDEDEGNDSDALAMA